MNKLWSNDSIHLKEVLLIPVLADSADSKDSVGVVANGVAAPYGRKGLSFSQSQSSSPAGTSASRRFSQECSSSGAQRITTPIASDGAENMDRSETSVSDFLSRIDASIRLTTKNVQKLEKQST